MNTWSSSFLAVNNPKQLMSVVSCAIFLAACGGNSDNNSVDDGTTPNQQPTRTLSDGYLKKVESKQLLVDAINASSTQSRNNDERIEVFTTSLIAASPVSAESQSDGASDSSAGFSETNTIVKGVDESDWLKYTGDFMIAVMGNELVIAQTNPDEASFTVVKRQSLDTFFQEEVAATQATDNTSDSSLDSRLIHSSSLDVELYTVAKGDETDIVLINRWYGGGWHYGSGHTFIKRLAFDGDENSFTEIWSYSLQNTTNETRKVGDKIYLVHNSRPINYWPLPFERLAVSTQFVDSLQSDQSSPELTIEDIESGVPTQTLNLGGQVTSEPIVSLDDCLVEDASLFSQKSDSVAENSELTLPDIPTVDRFTYLTALDVASPALTHSGCYAVSYSQVHLSTENLYLISSGENWGWWWGPFHEDIEQTTDIHQIQLSDLNYRGTGTVPGIISGVSDSNFYMGQVGDNFAVVTSVYTGARDYDHTLSVLQPRADAKILDVAGQIPNDTRPQEIGKPNESLYGIRFFGERAYIVTFEKVDPLYVVDLADPTDPYIAGELEIPGYSDYLHPLSDDLLIGIGLNAIPASEADIERRGTDFSWFQGVKVELYDVSDITNPTAVSKVDIGERGSSALGYKSLTFLQDALSGNYRFTVPASIHEGDADREYDVNDSRPFNRNAVVLFEVNPELKTMERVGEAVLSAANQSNTCSWWGNWTDMRSVQHGDAAYHLSRNRIVSHFWESASETVSDVAISEDEAIENSGCIFALD